MSKKKLAFFSAKLNVFLDKHFLILILIIQILILSISLSFVDQFVQSNVGMEFVTCQMPSVSFVMMGTGDLIATNVSENQLHFNGKNGPSKLVLSYFFPKSHLLYIFQV